MPSRKNNYIVEANVDGRDLGKFETWTGGDGDSEETTYTEGDSNTVPLGGKQTRDPVSIGRLNRPDRDIPIKEWLDSTRGKKDCLFTKQYVDDEGNPVGKPSSRRGKVKKVTDPEADKNSSDASTFEIEMTPYV